MVVLAASICTRGGNPVISRQFRDLSKERVTGLLQNFPTLLSNASNSQHTSVEDDNVRYVYRPLEEYYVVLITNKHSNILQDIETLNLFSKVINSVLRTVDEREIFDNCFELLSGFDEIITLGYKENVDSRQIMEFLAMDSHEERIQEIIDRNKELEATEASKRKAIELKMKELSRKHLTEFGVSSQDYGYQQQHQQQFQQQPIAQPIQQQYAYEEPVAQPASTRRGGLQLGKKSAGGIQTDMQQPLLVQQQQQQQRPTQQQYNQREPVEIPTPQKPAISNRGILLTLNEKFSAQITREGEISQADVKGDLQVRINDQELSFVKILMNKVETNSTVTTTFKTHPNVDKKLFNDSNIIALKDQSKPFPSNDQNLGVLRWRSTLKTNESTGLLPIILTTWVNNNNDGTIGLTFEYEVNTGKLIDEVSIIIPIINGSLESSDYDNGELKFTDDGLILTLNGLLENPSGSIEVIAKEIDDEEALFPMEVQFETTKKLNGELEGVSVKKVVSVEDDESLDCDVYYCGSSEGYYVI